MPSIVSSESQCGLLSNFDPPPPECPPFLRFHHAPKAVRQAPVGCGEDKAWNRGNGPLAGQSGRLALQPGSPGGRSHHAGTRQPLGLITVIGRDPGSASEKAASASATGAGQIGLGPGRARSGQALSDGQRPLLRLEARGVLGGMPEAHLGAPSCSPPSQRARNRYRLSEVG